MVWTAALTAGRVLLGKIGLNAGTLSKAGAWLKSALWGSNFSKATSVLSAGSMLLPAGKSVAQSSRAATQLQRADG